MPVDALEAARTAHVSATEDDALEEVLLVRAGAWLCGMPISEVIETMRPLPLTSVAAAPPYVLGASMIRGDAVPVVSLQALLEPEGASKTGARFVTVRAMGRTIAFAVDEVLGVRMLAGSTMARTPPLLGGVAGLAEKVGALDGGLLAILSLTRALPEDVVAALFEGAGA